MIIYFALIAVFVALDQGIKYWASSFLAEVGTIPLIKGIFSLTYAENEGASFSILVGKRWFFVITGVLMLGFLIYLLVTKKVLNKFGTAGLLLVISGTIGNIIDRIMFGYVVDMFEFKFINFAIFNVADVCLTVGGVICAIYFLFMDDKLRQARNDKINADKS